MTNRVGTLSEAAPRLTDILPSQRILVDKTGSRVPDKATALLVLADLLAPAVGVDHATVERVLVDRERLQSTGIGDGIAIPHASVEAASGQVAALLICPRGLPFEAIDGADVRIVFGVVGPRQATGDHLRILARISRLLRDPAIRDQLASAPDAGHAHALIQAQDSNLK
jgi:PTS system nitrogen regulatory IIA component